MNSGPGHYGKRRQSKASMPRPEQRARQVEVRRGREVFRPAEFPVIQIEDKRGPDTQLVPPPPLRDLDCVLLRQEENMTPSLLVSSPRFTYQRLIKHLQTHFCNPRDSVSRNPISLLEGRTASSLHTLPDPPILDPVRHASGGMNIEPLEPSAGLSATLSLRAQLLVRRSLS